MKLPFLSELENKCAWNLVRVYGLGYNAGCKLSGLQRKALKHALAVVGLGFFNASFDGSIGISCFWNDEEAGYGFVTKEDNSGNVGIYPLIVPNEQVYTSGYWEEENERL